MIPRNVQTYYKTHKLYRDLLEQPSHLLEVPGILNVSGHKGEPSGSWAGEMLHNPSVVLPLRADLTGPCGKHIWGPSSVVLVKLPSPHKRCPRTLYMRDHSLISTTGTLMASQTQTQGCDWFIGNWKRKLFFGKEALSHSERNLKRIQWSQRLHLQIITTWP